MDTKKICACRGDGRGYVSVRVTKFTNGSKLRLSGITGRGNLVPTQLYVIDETDQEKTAVLVFPLSKHTLVLKLEEIDGEGSVLDDRSAAIHPTWLKWSSRINYRLKSNACAQIRDIDGTDYFRHATIELNDCIPGQNSNILRGTLTLPSSNSIPYSLTLLNDQFFPIKTEYNILSDFVVPAESYAPTSLRQIDFSMKISPSQTTYTIYATDPSGQIRSNFAILEPTFYRELLDQNRFKTLNAAQDSRYSSWIRERLINAAVKREQQISKFEIEPLISIIVPLFQTPKAFFEDMVESVLDQTYRNFELILVNADPSNKDIARVIEELIIRDKRVTEKRLEKNLGISLNTAEGIKIAKGSYVAFLDHDDVLEPNALYEYVVAINRDPDIDLLYSDEDKLFPNGSLGDPYFKPDYSPHLLREINYICHFLMIRRSILNQLDPADPVFDGAQDYRMILQTIEKDAEVCHVPSILYHWRVSAGSTAGGANEKPYANTAGKLALQEHFDALSISTETLTTTQECRFRVNYLVDECPLVSIIIPSKDNIDVLDVCVSSILNHSTYPNYEIVIIENNSAERSTFEYYAKLSRRDRRIRIIRWENEFNFSKLINFGAAHAHGDYYLLLNNDTEIITPSWIETMLGICQEKTVGAVGAKLYYRDRTIQHAGVYVQGKGAGHLNHNLSAHETGYFNTAITTHEVSAVTAACLLTKRTAFESVGGFTEKYAVAFNDVDFCLKLRALNLLVVFTPYAELYHFESLSRGYETTVKKQIRFHREASMLNTDWPDYYVLGDPFMNPNLHPDNCYYRINDRFFRDRNNNRKPRFIKTKDSF